MATFRRSMVFSVIRLMVCGLLSAKGVYTMYTATGLWASVPDLALGFGCIVLSGLLIAPAVASILSAPWCVIYYPRKRLRKEDLKGMTECTRRNRWFESVPFSEPTEAQPLDIDLEDVLEHYTDQIRMAVCELRNEELGAALLDEALIAFRKTEDQIALRSAFIGAKRAVEKQQSKSSSKFFPEN